MSESDDTSDGMDGAAPAVHCRHLIVCRTVWFDPNRPDDGFSLGKLVVSLTPPAGNEFPLVCDRLFAFAQLYGTPGEYRLWIRVVRIDRDDSGEETETQLGEGEEPFEYPVSRPFELTGFLLVESLAVPMSNLVFPSPGLYEVQLFVEGCDAPLFAERLEVLK